MFFMCDILQLLNYNNKPSHNNLNDNWKPFLYHLKVYTLKMPTFEAEVTFALRMALNFG